MNTTLRILVPLDGSAEAEAALSEAERIAVGTAEVHLLHVVPSLPLSLDASSLGAMELHDRALCYLEEVRRRFPEMGGLDLIRTGEPADAIFQVTLEFNIDLIAMCTHARTGLGRWFLGSVAETVLQRAQLPVLLTRPGISAPRSVLRRVLVPLDGSEESFAMLTAVKRLALQTGAEVVLLHVNEQANSPGPRRGGLEASRIAEDPEHKILTVADRLGTSDLVFWQTIGEGDAVDEILEHAKTLDADLIVMSTHARVGRERTAFGSVAQTVLGRADRAVLLQKPLARAVATGTGGFP